MNLLDLALAVLLSFLPVFFWTVILKRKHRQSMLFFFVLNFVLAMGFAALFYHFLEYRIENWIQGEIPMGGLIFLSYLVAGICIEYGKNFIVRLTGGHYFKNLDDVMDLSFATALGFTFYLNIFHFYQLFQGAIPEVEGPVKMMKDVIQSIFYILPVHLFCSGIFGYFYGLALFASEELKAEHREQNWRYRLVAFKAMKIMEGTFISVLFYGAFFTILKFDPSIGDVTELLGLGRLVLLGTPIDEKLLPIFSFLFFSFGTLVLFQFLDKKRDLDRRALLIVKNGVPATKPTVSAKR